MKGELNDLEPRTKKKRFQKDVLQLHCVDIIKFGFILFVKDLVRNKVSKSFGAIKYFNNYLHILSFGVTLDT
jgi:hypothetical protein